jgi:acetyl esterase/lipase
MNAASNACGMSVVYRVHPEHPYEAYSQDP